MLPLYNVSTYLQSAFSVTSFSTFSTVLTPFNLSEDTMATGFSKMCNFIIIYINKISSVLNFEIKPFSTISKHRLALAFLRALVLLKEIFDWQ